MIIDRFCQAKVQSEIVLNSRADFSGLEIAVCICVIAYPFEHPFSVDVSYQRGFWVEIAPLHGNAYASPSWRLGKIGIMLKLIRASYREGGSRAVTSTFTHSPTRSCASYSRN